MTKAQSITKEVYVAIYLRLSRDDQNGNAESMSIGHQRDMLMAYCEERGWKVYDIYVDDGFTGTNFERPGFQRMIEDIKEGYISVVLTKDLSRLGRNYVMTGQYTDFFFPEHGVRYVAVNDSYDSAKDDNDIAPFKNILNEMYAKDISKKVRSVRQLSAKQGKFMGSKPPFGYVKSPEISTCLSSTRQPPRLSNGFFPRVCRRQ
jgi:DNA invertase Pin-like site-specific DNA recombinase